MNRKRVEKIAKIRAYMIDCLNSILRRIDNISANYNWNTGIRLCRFLLNITVDAFNWVSYILFQSNPCFISLMYFHIFKLAVRENFHSFMHQTGRSNRSEGKSLNFPYAFMCKCLVLFN